ncbi:MAG: alpha,alpha-trehalose-phosphate synthase (UDP-forming) [Acidimicrobiales bacterium]
MSSQIVVVANRLPVRRVGDGWQPSPGGLVRALVPILQQRDGAWVGWAGTGGEELEPFEADGIGQVPVPLTDQEIDHFYFGFCNGTLWPLYHDAVSAPEFHRRWWRAYELVNSRYADHVLETLAPDGIAWVQDYQLQLVPELIKRSRPDVTVGFYLHIPFPPIELFARMPWRTEIVRGLLGADVVAFQTRRSAENFIRCARRYGDAESKGRGELLVDGRLVRTQRAPIGIDVDEFRNLARSPEIEHRARQLRAEMGHPDKVILGVDRLDYTKGIDIRLRAVETLLHRSKRADVRYEFVQVAVPSREAVPAYQTLRENIEGAVGRINGDFARPGWSPVHYLYRSLPLEELVTYYVAADVMLVTPLRDGMNLVAKEYVACRSHNDGVLILSEFAGAAEQLRSALLVNPHDVDQVASTLERAVTMDPAEIQRRMLQLKRTVKRNDVYRWAKSCLDPLGA